MADDLQKKAIPLKDVLVRPDGRLPWEILPGENEQAHRYFRFFLSLEPKYRVFATIACKAYCKKNDEKYSRELAREWADLAAEWLWKARARAYEEYMHNKFDSKIIQLAEFHAEQFREYEEHLKVQTFQRSQEMVFVAEKMLEKAKQMLDVPVFEEETIEDDDGVKIVIKPGKNFKPADIPSFAKAAAQLAQIGRDLGLAAIQSMSPAVGDPDVKKHVDMSKLSDEQVAALRDQVSLNDVLDGNFDKDKYRKPGGVH